MASPVAAEDGSLVFHGTDIRIAAPNVELQSLPDYLRRDCFLFYYPDTEPLARKIAQASSKIELGEVRWA